MKFKRETVRLVQEEDGTSDSNDDDNQALAFNSRLRHVWAVDSQKKETQHTAAVYATNIGSTTASVLSAGYRGLS